MNRLADDAGLAGLHLRARLDRRRMARPAGGPSGPLGQEILDDAVFQRVEGHDRQTTARLEDPLGGGEPGLQLGQLFIDRDAQPLERAGGRMHLGPLAAAEGAFEEAFAATWNDRCEVGSRPAPRSRRFG